MNVWVSQEQAQEYVPPPWRMEFTQACFERQTIGASGADVFRIVRAGQPDVFLKTEPATALSELPGEIERLRWMAQVGLPAPAVLDALRHEGRHYLLMSAVPGQDMATAFDLQPALVLRVAAMALRILHETPIEDCPFDHRLEHRLADAGRRLQAGLVDESAFDGPRQGWSAAQVWEELLASRPDTQDLVVTHGDACLPNLMLEGKWFTGFIDCGRLGVADRFQDLALTARSIEHNFGPQWVDVFFQEYGLEADEGRMEFYRLLDEFF
ncbi:MAG: APH(3') family aminoglycoside O-phosphotransferase [Alcaligenes sp.]